MSADLANKCYTSTPASSGPQAAATDGVDAVLHLQFMVDATAVNVATGEILKRRFQEVEQQVRPANLITHTRHCLNYQHLQYLLSATTAVPL